MRSVEVRVDVGNAIGATSPQQIAARIEVPVLIAGGERDTMPDARRAPTAFTRAQGISLFGR